MAENSISGAGPICSKDMGVDRRQCESQHVTHAPAAPWDCRPAIAGGDGQRNPSIVVQNVVR